MYESWQPKILGIMQGTSDKTLQIAFSHNKAVLSSQLPLARKEFSLHEFGEMSVNEILQQIGVPMNENR